MARRFLPTLFLALMTVSTAMGRPCIVPGPDGAVELPPVGCDYVSPTELHLADGRPTGTALRVAPVHAQFFNIDRIPGGNLGGEIATFDSFVSLSISGTGELVGFSRDLLVRVTCEIHTAPRAPGRSVQTIRSELVLLRGEIFGDPDFDRLRLHAGSAFGLPASDGRTTLTALGDGTFGVDSLFEWAYEIEFVGASGSPLEGLAGVTLGSLPMQTGQPQADCPPLDPGQESFASTGKLVLDVFDDSGEPFVARLSSADLPDMILQRQLQNGDSIDTEILQLELSGFHPRVGPIEVRQAPLQSSLGQLKNVSRDPATCELTGADLTFDLALELSLPALGETWIPDEAIHVEQSLERLPLEDVLLEIPFLTPVLLRDQATAEPRGQWLYHSHHADPPFPSAGPDRFGSTLDLDLDLSILGLPLVHPSLQGPTTLERGSPQSIGSCTPGGAPCGSNGDCPLGQLCELETNSIPLELVEMQLEGFEPALGPLEIRVRESAPSTGFAGSQQADRTYRAESVLDAYVELDVQGVTLHNDQPLPLLAVGTGGLDGVRNLPPDPQWTYRTPSAENGSDCCEPHPSAGCSDSACQEMICMVDPFCCEQQWDGICAEIALREPLCLAGCGAINVPLLTEDGIPVGFMRNLTQTIGTPQDAEPTSAGDGCFDASLRIELTLLDPSCEESLELSGPVRVLRDAPAESPPDSGQDVMPTLMAKAVFGSGSSCAGWVTVRLSPAETSGGEIASLTPEEMFPADSFFDVFIELDTAFGTLHTEDPIRLTTTVNGLPFHADETHFGPHTPTPLLDASGTPVGEIVLAAQQVLASVACPADYRSTLRFVTRETIQLPLPHGGGGLVYDVWEGPLDALPALTGNLIQIAGPGELSVPALPPPGSGWYYLSRARFGSFGASWNSGGSSQVGNRDETLP